VAAVSPDLRREIERLVSALCDGDLTDADRDRLDQLLAADPECRRLYLELIDLHAALLDRRRPSPRRQVAVVGWLRMPPWPPRLWPCPY
jgi:anti-sigma factor RsiW